VLFGTPVVSVLCCICWFATGVRFLNIKQFIAKIGYQNTKSLELFKKLGFVEVLHVILTLCNASEFSKYCLTDIIYVIFTYVYIYLHIYICHIYFVFSYRIINYTAIIFYQSSVNQNVKFTAVDVNNQLSN